MQLFDCIRVVPGRWEPPPVFPIVIVGPTSGPCNIVGANFGNCDFGL